MRRMLTGISSMATKALLADLAAAFERQHGVAVTIESVGGVDAARRVMAGEAFDIVVLAADAIAKLAEAGRVTAATPLVRSEVAIAVKRGAARPDVGSEEALKRAVLGATTIGYSTGPSGTALAKLFERWGIAETIGPRIVTPPPGTPVGALVARGEIELGFQQRSEMMSLPGIDVIGPMPPQVPIVTVFTGALGARSARAAGLLAFLASREAHDTIRRHGMEPHAS